MRRAALAAAVLLSAPAAHALVLCDSMEQRSAFFRSLDPWRNALTAKRYEDLDRHYNQLIAETAAGRMTDQELHRWFELFSRANAGREPLHEDWIRAYPKSAAARLAIAYYYTAVGWNSRGTAYASETSNAQFQAMGESFRRSFQALPAAEALMEKPSLVAALKLDMLGAVADKDRLSEAYRDALKRFPDSLEVRVTWINYSVPKWGGSVEQVEKSIPDAKPLTAPDRRYIEYLVNQHLGASYRQEDPERAIGYYQKAIPMCPGLEGALTQMIHLLKDRKDFAKLVPALDTYIDRFPRSGWAYSMRAWTYVERKDWPPAYRDYEKAASLGHSEGYEGLAWMTEWGYGTKSDYRKAIDLYETAAANGSKTAREKADKIRKAAGIQMR